MPSDSHAHNQVLRFENFGGNNEIKSLAQKAFVPLFER